MNHRSNGRTFFHHIMLAILGAIGGIGGAILGAFISLNVYAMCCALGSFVLQDADAWHYLGPLLVLLAIPVGIVGLLAGSVAGASLATSLGSRLMGRSRLRYGETTTAKAPVTTPSVGAIDRPGKTALGSLLGAVVAVILACGGWILLVFPTSEPRTEAEGLAQGLLVILTVVGIGVIGPLAAIIGALVGTQLSARRRRKVWRQDISGSCPFAETERPSQSGQD